MKHFLIKFNHGVEIGAELAYRGHFKRTNDPVVEMIADDEVEHRENLEEILGMLGHSPNPVIDFFFTVVGGLIGKACRVFPIWSLDFVARSMEWFAVFNYRKLARLYPRFQWVFRNMAETEERHRVYFGAPTVSSYLKRTQVENEISKVQ